jgi:GAF domain-containing protein
MSSPAESDRTANLAAIFRVASTISSSLDTTEILKTTCFVAHEMLHADHCGLAVFHTSDEGKVVAEFPETLGTVGLSIKVRDIPAEEKLFHEKVPVCEFDVSNSTQLGEVGKNAARYGIKSMLLVPIVNKDKVVGTFGVDSITDHRQFTEEEIEFSRVLASQVAFALERAALFRTVEQRRKLLDDLDEKSRHLLISRDEAALKHNVVRLAAGLLDAPVAGLYANYPNHAELELTNVLGLPEHFRGTRISHGHGIAGQVVASGKAAFAERCSDCEEVLAGEGIGSVVAAPLSPAGSVEAVLFVARTPDQAPFGEVEKEILERFAARAALALEGGVSSPQHRLTRHLKILHKVRDYVQRSQDLDKVIHVLLTGMTADFGLGFNRALLFMLEAGGTLLQGKMGIGQMTKAAALAAWNEDQPGSDPFARYFELLESGELPVTELQTLAPTLSFPVGPDSGDAFSKAIYGQRWEKVESSQHDRLPAALRETLSPTGPVLLAPLIARNKCIGLLVVDNKFIGDVLERNELESLLTFASTAAAAIDNLRLFEQAQRGHETFRSLYESTEYLISDKVPETVIKDLGENLPKMTGAQDVSLLRIPPVGVAEIIVASHPIADDPALRVREQGLSRRVLASRKPYLVPDAAADPAVNVATLENGWKAALCLPLIVSGEAIGVAWLHYSAKHEFSDEEIQYVQVHVTHAAIACNNATRVIRLERLQKATRAMSGAFDLAQVRQAIVEGAREVLDAQFGALWPYDERLQRFRFQEFTSSGIPDDVLLMFRKHGEPMPGFTTFTALQNEYIPVSDVRKADQYTFLSPFVIDALKRAGIRSFQGVALKVGDEPVGVLFVSYRYVRNFSEEDERRLRNFAIYAALALKKAQLLEQKDKLVNAIEAVAQVNALQSWDQTLESVAEGMKDAIGCTAIVLYAHNPTTKSFSPPVMKGVRFRDRVLSHSTPSPTSVVVKMLAQDEPYEVPSIKDDPLFSETKFPAREGISSCIAVPLRSGDLKVGVMFVNYADPHLFSKEEVHWIKLFADHASVAIHQAQIIEERHELEQLSRKMLGTVNVQEVLNHGVNVGARMLRSEYCDIVLPDPKNEGLVVAAVHGWPERMVGTEMVKFGRLSQAGYSILERKPVIVTDFSTETRFTPPAIGASFGMKAGLAVPMERENQETVGAMLVHSKEPRTFTDAEATLLQLIANQTALALGSAQRYQALERRSRHLRSLYEAFESATTDPNIEETAILNEVIVHAVHSVTPAQKLRVVLGSIQRYHPENRTWKFAAFHSDPEMPTARSRAEDMLRDHTQPLGITGRVMRTGEAQLVSDVSENKDYYCVYSDIRSEIAVPIIRDGKVIGVLNLESDRVAAFDKEDLENLSAFASLVVIVFELTRLYKDLQEKDRRKTELLEVIAHELRTPIHSISVALQSLLAGDYGAITERMRRPIEMALKRVDEQNRLVSNTLDAARLVEGIDALKRSRTSVASLIDVTEGLFRPIADQAGVELRIVLPHDNPLMAYVDGDAIQKVLNNLTGNALKFTPSGGTVTISAVPESDRLVIRVEDTGTGIHDHDKERIFDRYYQSDEAIRQSRGGLGIGLYIVKKYVALHGGSVQVRSPRGNGSGSIFSVTLPIGSTLAGEGATEPTIR